jgi:hypothetical protein
MRKERPTRACSCTAVQQSNHKSLVLAGLFRCAFLYRPNRYWPTILDVHLATCNPRVRRLELSLVSVITTACLQIHLVYGPVRASAVLERQLGRLST